MSERKFSLGQEVCHRVYGEGKIQAIDSSDVCYLMRVYYPDEDKYFLDFYESLLFSSGRTELLGASVGCFWWVRGRDISLLKEERRKPSDVLHMTSVNSVKGNHMMSLYVDSGFEPEVVRTEGSYVIYFKKKV